MCEKHRIVMSKQTRVNEYIAKEHIIIARSKTRINNEKKINTFYR